MGRDIGFTITVKGTEQQLKKIGLLEQQLAKLATQRTKLLKKTKEGVALSKEEQVALGKLTTESKKLQAQKSQTLAQIKIENDLVKSTAGSYNRLVLENKKLTDASRRLSDPLGKNRKRFQELSTKISTNTDKLKKMDAAMGRSFRNVGNYSGAIGKLRGSFVAMGAAIAAGIIAFRTFTRIAGATLDIVIDFDQAVADLGSILGKTSDEMQILTEDAQRLGSSTAFTATEVAKLQKEFAKLGFSEKEILNATEATLSLASATNTELNEAAKVVGATVRGFNLDAAETQRVVDVMAKSFSSSALDMAKFQVAMAKVAPVAKAVGLDIEETTGIMGGLADAGLEASIIGTSLRRIFIELSAKGLTLGEALGRITGSQNRLNEAEELFGTRAATAALVMAENSEKARELTEELRNAGGTAQTMAETQLDTLQGALTIAKSAWEGFILGLESGRGVLGKTLRGLIDFGTAVLNLATPTLSLSAEINSLTKETEQNEKEVNDLVTQYEELNSIVDPSIAQQIELNKVISSLGKRIPEAATEFDKYGNIIAISTEKIKDNLEAQRENTEFQREKSIQTLRDQIEANNDSTASAIRTREHIDQLFSSEKVRVEQLGILNERIRQNTIDNSLAVLELRRLNAATGEEEIALLGAATQLNLTNESTEELIRLQRLAADSTDENADKLSSQLNAEIKSRFENTEERKKLAKENKDLATGETDDEIKAKEKAAEDLQKIIEKNNATLLELNRELVENEISLTEEGFDKQRAVVNEAHKQEIEDLEAQKGEVDTINAAIDALIESREKSHTAELAAIKQEGIDKETNQRQLALDLEQQEKLTEVAKSEDTEKEKQQAILDIQIEFAEKRLSLLEETADLTDVQVRLQIEQLKTTLAELKEESAEEEPTGLAGFLGISEDETQLLIDQAIQVTQKISDTIFSIQQKNDKRKTDAAIKSSDKEAKAELDILRNQLDKGIITESEFDKRSAAINDEADKRQEAIEKKAFQRNKRLAAAQAVINGALAVTTILAQVPKFDFGVATGILTAAAIVTTAAELAVIASTKFKEGGELVGASHSQGGIKAGGVEFEGGEGVINKQSMGSGDVLSVSGTPKQIASQINSYKGFGVPFGGGGKRKFQLGGVAPAPNIAPSGGDTFPGIVTSPTFEETAELIAGALNTQVVQVVETEISDTQGDVAVIEALQD